MITRSSILAFLVALTVGCAGEVPGPDVVVVDSAGVRVVTNVSFSPPAWTVGPEPILDLGTVDGGGPEQFFRVSAARRMGPGSLVIADVGSSELRVFSTAGAHRSSFGGDGEGPGEFRIAGPFWRLAGDSIWVWDPRLRRASVFDSSGDFGRAVTLQDPILNPSPVTVATDGRAIFSSERFDFSDGESFRMMYIDFLAVDDVGAFVDSLPRQPLAEFGRLGETGMIGSPLFAGRTTSTGDGTGYWVGAAQAEELRRYSFDGRLEMVVRWPEQDREVGPDAAQIQLQTELDDAPPDTHARIRQLHSARPVEGRFPSHERLLAGAAGEVWMQHYERPGHVAGSTWTAVDAEGRLRGQIETPRGFRVLEIGTDYVLGVGRDQLDVEHVRLYELRRDGS